MFFFQLPPTSECVYMYVRRIAKQSVQHVNPKKDINPYRQCAHAGTRMTMTISSPMIVNTLFRDDHRRCFHNDLKQHSMMTVTLFLLWLWTLFHRTMIASVMTINTVPWWLWPFLPLWPWTPIHDDHGHASHYRRYHDWCNNYFQDWITYATLIVVIIMTIATMTDRTNEAMTVIIIAALRTVASVPTGVYVVV
jgi:hypothetical protein